MPTFKLDSNYAASYVSCRHPSGYVAKGTVFLRGRPVEIFEAHGLTILLAAEAARLKAQEVHRRLKATTYRKAKERAAKKR